MLNCSKLGKFQDEQDVCYYEEEGLRGDFVAIIASFCTRLYGKRRVRRKTEQVLHILQQDGESGESKTCKEAKTEK